MFFNPSLIKEPMPLKGWLWWTVINHIESEGVFVDGKMDRLFLIRSLREMAQWWLWIIRLTVWKGRAGELECIDFANQAAAVILDISLGIILSVWNTTKDITNTFFLRFIVWDGFDFKNTWCTWHDLWKQSINCSPLKLLSKLLFQSRPNTVAVSFLQYILEVGCYHTT